MIRRNRLAFLEHIVNMSAANGRRRIYYAITNAIMVLLTVAFVFLGYYMLAHLMPGTKAAASAGSSAGNVGVGIFTGGMGFIFIIVFAIAFILAGIGCFLFGFVGEIVLIIITSIAIGRYNHQKRKIANETYANGGEAPPDDRDDKQKRKDEANHGGNIASLVISCVTVAVSIAVLVILFALIG